MKLKKKYIFLTLSIFLSLIMLLGIYFYHTPKYKVLRAIQKTFIKPEAPLSITEPLVLLQAESVTIDSSFTLNQLNLPLLPPKVSSKLSLIEGISVKTSANYSWIEQKSNLNLTLAYLYKSYISASVYADKDELFVQIPDVLKNYFSLNATTLGKDFNDSVFSDFLDYQLPEDYGFTLFPSIFEKNFNWKEVTVHKTEDSYVLQIPEFPPVTLCLDSKNRISCIDFTLSDFICHLTIHANNLAGNFTLQDSSNTPLYSIAFEGSYKKQSSDDKATLQLSSLDLQDEKGTFHLNFYGDISLTKASSVETMPEGKVYKLFDLTKSDIFNFSTEIAANLLDSNLKPFLSFLQ